MRLGKFLVAAAAVSMTVAPAMAANPAASLSVSKSVRASAPSAQKDGLAGEAVLVLVMGASA